MEHRVRCYGFSLLELSIVLVIVGLLAGGVIVGRDLIQAAELRRVLTELKQLNTAALAFKTKYNALPGDFPEATRYWPADASCPYTPARSTPATATCDGDGNGRIADIAGVGTQYEAFRFWQHLANAGLWSGQYTGTSLTGNSDNGGFQAGLNVPESYRGGGLVVKYLTNTGLQYPTSHSVRYSHVFALHIPSIPATGLGVAPIFTAEEARYLDDKYDDGKPTTGIMQALVWAIFPSTLTCMDCGSLCVGNPTEAYAASSPGPACYLAVKADF